MSALLKMEMYETAGYEAAPLAKSAGWLPVVIVTAQGTAAYEPAVPVVAETGSTSVAKNIALFLASPFIGLAFIVATPFIGLGALAWVGSRSLAAR